MDSCAGAPLRVVMFVFCTWYQAIYVGLLFSMDIQQLLLLLLLMPRDLNFLQVGDMAETFRIARAGLSTRTPHQVRVAAMVFSSA